MAIEQRLQRWGNSVAAPGLVTVDHSANQVALGGRGLTPGYNSRAICDQRPLNGIRRGSQVADLPRSLHSRACEPASGVAGVIGRWRGAAECTALRKD